MSVIYIHADCKEGSCSNSYTHRRGTETEGRQSDSEMWRGGEGVHSGFHAAAHSGLFSL